MEQSYLNLIKECLEDGDFRMDRTKVGTYSLFGKQLIFNLSGNVIPLLTTKRIPYKSVLKELLWIMKGQTNSKILEENNVHIWSKNGSREFLDLNKFYSRSEGDLGPVYGFQWRHAGAQYIDSDTDYTNMGIDQLKQVVHQLKFNPSDRRIIICSWNVPQLNEMVLPPCHCLVQFYVRNSQYLDCQLYQRSADLGLGVPFNIASYSFLLHVLGKWCNLTPGKFIHSFGDVHIYSNHYEQLKHQITRKPYDFPTLEFDGVIKLEDLNSVTYNEWCNSFKIKDYKFHPTINLNMAL